MVYSLLILVRVNDLSGSHGKPSKDKGTLEIFP